ncbi:DUF305 domain-containing protein [Candidatus Roizmanbacteria bacterium]|nr:DUF305 domain-containing protein [Candidatus Roizmanbacteria bacterium]
MKNQSISYGIIGLLLGVVLTAYIASNAVNNNMTGMMRMMGMRTEGLMEEKVEESMMGDEGMHSGSSMSDMMDSLNDKTGDEFDKAFIEAMIVHHQGAIDMAKEAQTNAKHLEIKNLADNIISAQEDEINQMRQWYEDWGY